MPKTYSALRSGRSVRFENIDDRTDNYEGWNQAYDEHRDDWGGFVRRFGDDVSDEDMKLLDRYWDSEGGFGYIQTGNSFEINEALYKPGNENKSIEELFTRQDSKGVLRDLETVKTLDRAISTHKTPENAVYTRMAGSSAIKSIFGFTSEQMNVLKDANFLSDSQLKQLSSVFKGRTSASRSFTSTSANANLNVFKGKKFERRLYVPKGTNAMAARSNRDESEVIFGRGVQTELIGIGVNKKTGAIILHERFVGYKKR